MSYISTCEMFSKEKALQFIKILGIQEPEYVLTTNKVEFLNKLISAVYGRIPFQNVTLMSKPLKERRRPSLEEVMQAMLDGTGGVCYTMNMLTFLLLRSLGYDVYLNNSKTLFFKEQAADDHLILLVRNLKKDGDLYLVDTGAAHPTFEAISLDFEVESPVYCHSYMQYKFVKEGSKIRRMFDRSVFTVSAEEEKFKASTFKPFYEFKVKPTTDIDQISSEFDIVYTDPDFTPFHTSLRAIKFSNRRLVLICHYKLALETENGEIKITLLNDDKELELAYKVHFPELSSTTVKNAIQNWKNAKV